MTLFWHNTGPLIRYQDGILHVEDLNPEAKIRFRMSRTELLRLSLKAFLAAIR
jgi:hypothetical protein